MRSGVPWIAVLSLLTCVAWSCEPWRPSVTFDWDGDGTPDSGDCAPESAGIHPEAYDHYGDGVDQNCDGVDGIDEDGDSVASEDTGGADCDDGDPDVYGGATEVPYDGIDQDCDGQDLDDVDGDGHAFVGCGGDDCDDNDPSVFPGAEEICGDGIDQDCGDDLHVETDDDGDGYRECGGDCDDTDPEIHPAYADWDRGGVDEDCDGTPDNSLSEADLSFTGISIGDQAGYALCTDGDLDGDGVDDLVVGSPLANVVAGEDGKVYVVFGRSQGWPDDLVDADLTLSGVLSGRFGQACAMGDIDGDGVDDLVAGAPNYVGGGAVYIVLGREGGWPGELSAADTCLLGESVDDFGGSALSAAGDFNGDSYADVLIGAPQSDAGGTLSGRAYLFLGSDDGITETNLGHANALFTGEYTSKMGSAVTLQGDLDGDGLSDLVVGAPYDTQAVHIVFGHTAPLSGVELAPADVVLGTSNETEAGSSLASGFDATGDGLDDLLVGAPGIAGDADGGTVYLVRGREAGWPEGLAGADMRFYSDVIEDYLGQDVAGMADIDGDGADEILVGASADDTHVNNGGRVFLLRGRSEWEDAIAQQADVTFFGTESNIRAGSSVTAAGDINGDGVADIVIGAPNSSMDLVDPGHVFLLISPHPVVF